VRSWNAPDLAAYLAALDASRYSPGDWEELSTAQMALERLLLGLRTAQGVDIVALEANLVPRFRSRNAALLRRLTDDGLAILHNDILRLTAEGMAVGDAVPTFFDVE
jgi:coproporphyrinogen III oxidase-like Fe-S oxidoreductase